MNSLLWLSALWTIWWLSWWLPGWVGLTPVRNQQQQDLYCGQTVSPGKTEGTRESSGSMRERSPAMWVYKYNPLPSPAYNGFDFARTWQRWISVIKEASRPTGNLSRVKVVSSFRRDRRKNLVRLVVEPGTGRGVVWSELRAVRLFLPGWRSPAVSWEFLRHHPRERNICK